MEADKEMLTTQEVLVQLRISKTTLYRLIREGKLVPANHNPVLNRQARLEFRRDDVDRLKNQPA